LWLSFIDGRAALTEYLGTVLRPASLRDRVISHPLYRAFVAVAPGVGELMAMGKIRDELRQRDGLRHRYDYVVVDAGASGHALPYLRMATAAQRTFTARGRVRRESEKIARLLRDPTQTAIHVVTLAEHMPLCEAEAIVTSLRADPALPIRSLLVNRCLVPSPPGADDAATRMTTMAVGAPLEQAREALLELIGWGRGWENIQEREIARFEKAQGATLARLPNLVRDDGGPLGRDELAVLADAVRSYL
jgi:anion-transporting  ArsA/GET3 family ATPase